MFFRRRIQSNWRIRSLFYLINHSSSDKYYCTAHNFYKISRDSGELNWIALLRKRKLKIQEVFFIRMTSSLFFGSGKNNYVDSFVVQTVEIHSQPIWMLFIHKQYTVCPFLNQAIYCLNLYQCHLSHTRMKPFVLSFAKLKRKGKMKNSGEYQPSWRTTEEDCH